MFRTLIRTWPVWMPLPIRLATGAIFIAHGSQKVLGKFSGPGLRAWTAMNTPFPFMRPAWLWMGAAAFAEFLGGILVLLGLFTRVGAFFIAMTMLTAIIGLHWPNFFANNNGIEYPAALLAMTVALLISGGGHLSIDKALMRRR
ncbi:MAG: DoxX family protein [Pyrinomonadaceae bacterium]